MELNKNSGKCRIVCATIATQPTKGSGSGIRVTRVPCEGSFANIRARCGTAALLSTVLTLYGLQGLKRCQAWLAITRETLLRNLPVERFHPF